MKLNDYYNKFLQDKLIICLGSITITLWTLFNFFNKAIIFDLTGQQLLARQWLSGLFGGSVTAPTNYIIKILFIYIPSEILNIPPKLSLILFTILINIFTFLGIYYICRNILNFFQVPTSTFFKLLAIWLTTVAGSVFWIEFSNSRNIEVLAGLAIVYLGLLTFKNFTRKKSLILFALSSLTFFMDPMQLYVTAFALIAYHVANVIFFDKSYKNLAMLTYVIFLGYLGSLIISTIIKSFTNVEFVSSVSTKPNLLIFNHLDTTIIETSKNLLRLISGTSQMGLWRQILNLVLVIVFFAFSTLLITKRRILNEFNLFIFIFLSAPVVIYMLSGQAINRIDNSRYLIMFAPALVIFLSSLENTKGFIRKILISSLCIVLILNISSLIFNTVKTSKLELVGERISYNRYAFLKENNYTFGYASMDTAITSMYLFQNEHNALLPLACEVDKLKKANLFFDKAFFNKFESTKNELIPIILDDQSINNSPHTCNVQNIINQFGNPALTGKTRNNDTVLIYRVEQLSKLRF